MARYWGYTLMYINDSIIGLRRFRVENPNSKTLELFLKQKEKLLEEFLYVTNPFSTLGTETSRVRKYLVRLKNNSQSIYYGRTEFIQVLDDEELAFAVTPELRQIVEKEEREASIPEPLEAEQITLF